MKKLLYLFVLSGCTVYFQDTDQIVRLEVGGQGSRSLSAKNLQSYETLHLAIQDFKGMVIAQKAIPGGSPSYSLDARLESGRAYKAIAVVEGDGSYGFAKRDFVMGAGVSDVVLQLEDHISYLNMSSNFEFRPEIFSYTGELYSNAVTLSTQEGPLSQMSYKVNGGAWTTMTYDTLNAQYFLFLSLINGQDNTIELRYVQKSGNTVLYTFNVYYNNT